MSRSGYRQICWQTPASSTIESSGGAVNRVRFRLFSRDPNQFELMQTLMLTVSESLGHGLHLTLLSSTLGYGRSGGRAGSTRPDRRGH